MGLLPERLEPGRRRNRDVEQSHRSTRRQLLGAAGTAAAGAIVGTARRPRIHGRQRVDLIMEGEVVVTMDDDRPLIDQGAVAVAAGRIVAIDSQRNLLAAYDAETLLPGDGMVLMPGLVNGHGHTAMVLFRGLADDLPLGDWLQTRIGPAEARFVSGEFVRLGTQLGCWEMIRGGTTTFVDMYFEPDATAGVVEQAGMRALITPGFLDFPHPGFTGWNDSFAAAIDFVERWRGRHPRVTPGFGPHAPYTVSPDHLLDAIEAARRYDVPLTIHLAETEAEVGDIQERYGVRPIEHLERLGVLEPRLIAAHVVWPDDEEIDLIGRRGVGVIHNPTSNLKLGSGVAPVPQMLTAGVKLGLGTDGAAANNNLDLWEEMRLAALLHKGVARDATVVPAHAAVRMATRGGAEALGMADRIGAITVGHRADLIQVRLTEPRMLPRYDIYSHLAYVLAADDVDTVVVDGQVLMHGRQVLTLDGAAISAEVAKVAEEIRESVPGTVGTGDAATPVPSPIAMGE